MRQRAARLIDLYRTFQPEVVVIELFPFGRRKFRDEILALLDESRCAPRPLVVTSVRDLLVDRGSDQTRHDDRVRDLVDRYFDLVLVHTDPAFATLGETFRPTRPIAAPIHHTGFVIDGHAIDSDASSRSGVLVSGGGGRFAARLYHLALDAHERLAPSLIMTIVAGPLCPDEAFRELRDAAGRRPGVRVERTVGDLCSAMRRAAVSVSQCGYNTALDIVRAGVPAVVVPFNENGDTEQTDRAARLERLRLVRTVDPAGGSAALAAAIDAARHSAVPPASLDLRGGERSAAILMRELARRARCAGLAERCV
jgi:predicted glycosyltransferase